MATVLDTEYDRAKVPPYNGNDPPPAPGSLKRSLFPTLLNEVQNKGTQGVRARYGAELPPIISIVRYAGRPVILGMDVPPRTWGVACNHATWAATAETTGTPLWPRLRGHVGTCNVANFRCLPSQHVAVRDRYGVASHMREGSVTRQLREIFTAPTYEHFAQFLAKKLPGNPTPA